MWVEILNHIGAKGIELFRIFTGQHYPLTCEPVPKRIAGDFCFAFSSPWSRAFLSVSLVSFDLECAGHLFRLLPY